MMSATIAAALMALGPQAASPATPPSPAKQNAPALAKVLITDFPAVVELKPALVGRDAAVCVDAVVRVPGSTSERLLVTTAGLGSASLAVVAKGEKECRTNSSGAPLITIDNVSVNGQAVRLVIPPEAFPRSGSVQGRVIVISQGSHIVDAPVKLQRAAGSPVQSVTTAGLWFVGLIIPAGMTAIAGYFAFRAQQSFSARSAANDEWVKFKSQKDKDGEIETLFHSVFPAVVAGEGKRAFARRVVTELRDRGVFEKMPLKLFSRLRAALGGEEPGPMIKALTQAFPEYRSAVLRALDGRS